MPLCRDLMMHFSNKGIWRGGGIHPVEREGVSDLPKLKPEAFDDVNWKLFSLPGFVRSRAKRKPSKSDGRS